jgi:hypothetical protein
MSQGSTLTPEQRSQRARMAAHRRWAQEDRYVGTQRARDAFLARFEKFVDPQRVLPTAERIRRAESAKKAYFTDLALRSSRSRTKAGK